VWYLGKAVCKYGVSEYDELRHRAKKPGLDGGEEKRRKKRSNDGKGRKVSEEDVGENTRSR
jgi:hypothetical protein